MALSKPHNVSDKEATVRLTLASFVVGVSAAVAFYAHEAIVTAFAVLAIAGGVLLAKSAAQRYCPVRETGVVASESLTRDDRHR